MYSIQRQAAARRDLTHADLSAVVALEIFVLFLISVFLRSTAARLGKLDWSSPTVSPNAPPLQPWREIGWDLRLHAEDTTYLVRQPLLYKRKL
jgi:hypothetical protein